MRILLILLFVALTTQTQARSLVVLGDSISAAYKMEQQQGWVSLLQQRLNDEGYAVQVTNASVSGDTTQNGIARLGPVLKQTDADIVIIELGGNDGLRGTPPFAIKRNLQRLVDMAKDAGAQVLLLGMRLPTNYGPAYAQQYLNIYPSVADESNVALVPFFMQDVVFSSHLMSDDGIHPNAAGQPYLMSTVWPYVEEMLNE